MREIAIRLAYYTSKTYPSVGGRNQIAILQKGSIVKIGQETFADPPKLLVNFSLMVGVRFEGLNALVTEKGIASLFVKCRFGGTERSLDGDYFFADDFRDTALKYDGGLMYFDKSNTVSNSVLVIGRHANRHDPAVLHLTNEFSWSEVIYEQPRLQP
jgi:hypothetical protein